VEAAFSLQTSVNIYNGTWCLGEMIIFIFSRMRMTVLRRIFGPKRNEVRGGWRKLHNEELHNLYSSPNIIRNIK
jgi:hypothetical protein